MEENLQLMLVIAILSVVTLVTVTVIILGHFNIVLPKGRGGKDMYLSIKSMLYDKKSADDIILYIAVHYNVKSRFVCYNCLSKAAADDIEFFINENYLDI